MYFIRSAIAALIGCVITGTAIAQDIPPMAVTPGRTAGFDTMTATVPLALPTFRSILARFETRPKDEFETSAEYAARVRSHVVDEWIVLALPDDRSRRCAPTFSYSADSGVITTRLRTERGPDRDPTHYSALAIECASHEGASYEGVNGFGAKTTVQAFHDTTMEINYLRGSIGMVLTKAVAFPMARDTARVVKPLLAAAVVFRPAVDGSGQLVIHRFDSSPPTRQVPIDLVTYRTILNVDRAYLWIYNSRTGVVYKKVDFADLVSRY